MEFDWNVKTKLGNSAGMHRARIGLECKELGIRLEFKERAGNSAGMLRDGIRLVCKELGIRLECKDKAGDSTGMLRAGIQLECEELGIQLECKEMEFGWNAKPCPNSAALAHKESSPLPSRAI